MDHHSTTSIVDLDGYRHTSRRSILLETTVLVEGTRRAVVCSRQSWQAMGHFVEVAIQRRIIGSEGLGDAETRRRGQTDTDDPLC